MAWSPIAVAPTLGQSVLVVAPESQLVSITLFGASRMRVPGDQAINYAQNRASFRSGEIRILDSSGKVERTIPFSEADRKL
jgi:hypothetical protein